MSTSYTIVNAAGRNQINFLEELLKDGEDINNREGGPVSLPAACRASRRSRFLPHIN